MKQKKMWDYYQTDEQASKLVSVMRCRDINILQSLSLFEVLVREIWNGFY